MSSEFSLRADNLSVKVLKISSLDVCNCGIKLAKAEKHKRTRCKVAARTPGYKNSRRVSRFCRCTLNTTNSHFTPCETASDIRRGNGNRNLDQNEPNCWLTTKNKTSANTETTAKRTHKNLRVTDAYKLWSATRDKSVPPTPTISNKFQKFSPEPQLYLVQKYLTLSSQLPERLLWDITQRKKRYITSRNIGCELDFSSLSLINWTNRAIKWELGFEIRIFSCCNLCKNNIFSHTSGAQLIVNLTDNQSNI